MFQGRARLISFIIPDQVWEGSQAELGSVVPGGETRTNPPPVLLPEPPFQVWGGRYKEGGGGGGGRQQLEERVKARPWGRGEGLRGPPKAPQEWLFFLRTSVLGTVTSQSATGLDFWGLAASTTSVPIPVFPQVSFLWACSPRCRDAPSQPKGVSDPGDIPSL